MQLQFTKNSLDKNTRRDNFLTTRTPIPFPSPIKLLPKTYSGSQWRETYGHHIPNNFAWNRSCSSKCNICWQFQRCFMVLAVTQHVKMSTLLSGRRPNNEIGGEETGYSITQPLQARLTLMKFHLCWWAVWAWTWEGHLIIHQLVGVMN